MENVFICDCGGKIERINHNDIADNLSISVEMIDGQYGQWECVECKKKFSGYFLLAKNLIEVKDVK